MPPCPSIIVPQSLTPRSRLIADITRPPRNPASVIISETAAAWRNENGVTHHRLAPSSVALATPPANPSSVFDGDTCGAILIRPASFPHTYWSTSLDCTT